MKERKKLKKLIIIFSTILGCLLLTAIIQTFVLNSKQAQLNNLVTENSYLSQQEKDLKDQSDYKESQEYQDEYWKNENGYGQDGDKKIEAQ